MKRSDRLKKAIYEKIRGLLLLEKEPREVSVIVAYEQSEVRLKLDVKEILKSAKDK